MSRSHPASWPRLYLDTAEILTIADGKVDREIVRELVSAMSARCVVLVISLEHLQDSLTRADSNAPDRVTAALERFPLRAVVVSGPSAIEPWPVGVGDIEIAPAANIREVLMHPRRGPILSELASAQDAIHNADVSFQQAQAAFAEQRLSNAEHTLALQVIITLVRGWRGTDVDEVIEYWATRSDLRLSSAVRASLVAHLQPIAQLMSKFVADERFDDVARLSILTRMRDGFGAAPLSHAPGLFLAARLATCRTQNRTRTPSRSDSLDGLHAMHFPYVDLATCDRQTYHCLAPHLPRIPGPRRPILFRNGQLPNVLNAVNALAMLVDDG